MSNSSWSDGIRIHEATNLFPMMPEKELDELAADIAEHGLRQPIAVIEREGGFALLDGRKGVAGEVFCHGYQERRDENEAGPTGFLIARRQQPNLGDRLFVPCPRKLDRE